MADKKKGGKAEDKVPTEHDEEFKHLVRLSQTDLPGNKKVIVALTQVKGVGIRMAPLIADRAGIDRNMKIGNLSDADVEKVQAEIDGLGDTTPQWMRNRRKDYDSGDDLHLIGSELDMTFRDDINRLKKIRSYRGVRHEAGLPVRGQRTRSNGRSGLTVGVQRKK